MPRRASRSPRRGRGPTLTSRIVSNRAAASGLLVARGAELVEQLGRDGPDVTAPPVPGCLVTTHEPVGGDLADGEARVPGRELVEEGVVAPVAWAPHSTTCPATTAPASASRSSGDQPCHQAAGPTTKDASVTRPVTTTSAPASSAAAMPKPPRYALAVATRSSRPRAARPCRGGAAPRRAPRGRRGDADRSSPSTTATRGARGPTPRPAARDAPSARAGSARRRSRRRGRPLEAVAEHVGHLALEGRHPAGVGIAAAQLPQDEHRELGEVVAGEHVERARARRAARVPRRGGRRRTPSSSRCERPRAPLAHLGGASRARARPRVGRRRPGRWSSHSAPRARSRSSEVSSRCRRWVATRQNSTASPRIASGALVAEPPGRAVRARRALDRDVASGAARPCAA